jgi:hypothetical protein
VTGLPTAGAHPLSWETIMTHWFVALDGDDGNSGLGPGEAFRHVAHGVEQLEAVFRHNWVHNINDDGVFVGRTATNLRITGNVFEKCLTVLSLASTSRSGPIFLHRNLIDLRGATAGRRPVTDRTPSRRTNGR